MKKTIIILAAVFLSTAIQAAVPSYYNVRKYGAKGDGKNIDSDAINKAIISASADGGGAVYLPAGTYLSYSIRMKDNIRLYLDRGAVIKAAVPTEKQGYDIAEANESTYQDFGHSHWKNSLIWGIGLNQGEFMVSLKLL